MKSAIVAAFCGSVMSLFTPSIEAQSDLHPDTDLIVRATDDLSPNDVDWNVGRGPIAALAINLDASSMTAAQRNEGRRLGGTLVGVVRIRSDLLVVPDTPRSMLTDQPAVAFNHLTLALEGAEYVLDVVESIHDRQRNMRHVLAVVINESIRSYARFTIDEQSGATVGTVNVRRGVYRIIPGESTDTQLVFRLDSADQDELGERRELLRGRSVSDDLAKIEARHVQVLTLARVHPWYVKVSGNDTLLVIRGGELGDVDLARVADPGEVTKVLRSLSALTRWQNGDEIEVTSVPVDLGESDGDFAIRYRQVIHGIPVNEDQEINFDSSGKVSFVLSSRVDPAKAPAPEHLLDEKRAFEAAVEVVKRGAFEASVRYERQELSIEPLMYVVEGPERRLVPTWTFGVRIADRADVPVEYVTVDAQTGEATLRERGIHAVGEHFRHKIYRTVSGAPMSGGGADTELVWLETNDADIECWAEDYCHQEEYNNPAHVIGILNLDMGNAADDATCCFEIGRNVPGKFYDELDVIIDSVAAGNAMYDPGNQTVIFNPDVDYARSFEIIAHEIGHAHVHAYNPGLYPGNTVPTDPKTRAFLEGSADAFAGVMSESRKSWVEPAILVGEPWILGDGTGGMRLPTGAT